MEALPAQMVWDVTNVRDAMIKIVHSIVEILFRFVKVVEPNLLKMESNDAMNKVQSFNPFYGVCISK